MRILFCKISYMKYYKGKNDNDIPVNGGGYIKEHGSGHEEYNFDPVTMEGIEKPVCLGFFETKSTNGKSNQLHIENIDGCKLMKKEDMVDDVLVVWCATASNNTPVIVGWYKHADVYRYYQSCTFDTGYIQYYNIMADAENCVLLPADERFLPQWRAVVARKDGFGFGQSMQWYAKKPEAQEYIKRLVDNIEKYNGKAVI